MDLNDEIRRLFATTTNKTASLIQSTLPYEAWVIRLGNEYGVGIPVEETMKISERFSGARIWTSPMSIQGKYYDLLMFTSENNELRMEFSAICSQFVDPGNEGKDRKQLVESPHNWWDRWKSLLGNSVTNKSPYAILGELLTFKRLLDNGHSPVWTGGFGGVKDIATNTFEYEVKSTTMRYESVVTIAGQFQLHFESAKSLSLIFCRFEPSPKGESINDVVNQLVMKGISASNLEQGLVRCGYEAGSSARLETFKMLEMRRYIIDDTFPSITMKSFVGGKLPEAVIQFTYRLELTGIPYESWMD